MTDLTPAYTIKPPNWMRAPELTRVLDTLNFDNINARMVGGCIRNHFFNKDIYDIDIACIFTPEKTMEILNKHGIRTIPTGLKHGTITAHINGKNFEITTLRRDIETDGRHASVSFTDNWVDDAKRRDFTINALYADRDGSIYDPTDQGLHDIQHKIVRFIGNADQRIQEDYLRILRFFRFYADYHQGKPDVESLQACTNHQEGLSRLSDERIADELFKILGSPHAAKATSAIENHHILGLKKGVSAQLQILIDYQNRLDSNDIITRFHIASIDKKYIKNNKLLNFINNLNKFKKSWDGNIKHALYHFERPIVVQGLCVLKAKNGNIDDHMIAQAITIKPPEFPIITTDIMQTCNLSEGPELGKKIKEAEKIWINSGFQLTRDEILDRI